MAEIDLSFQPEDYFWDVPPAMGGEYLPDLRLNEVEIGRLTLASTLSDVTCVYAEPTKQGIHYRAVDEYEGMTLGPKTEMQSTKPLTLGEFIDFFLEASGLLETLGFNAEGSDLRKEGLLAFFEFSSPFYPQLDEVIRARIEPWLDENFPEFEEEDDEQLGE